MGGQQGNRGASLQKAGADRGGCCREVWRGGEWKQGPACGGLEAELEGRVQRYHIHQEILPWTSLMVQWLRIRLPMQETWVRALVRENPTCCGATKPMHHSY